MPRQMAFLSNLPADLLPMIKSYMNKTRLDWRTCKSREAALIRGLECENVIEVRHGEFYEVDPEMLRWTLAGRLFISKIFEDCPLWANMTYYPQLTPPPPMDDYTRWYILQYRWILCKSLPPDRYAWRCDVTD
jgi:hypothetical protein